MRNENLPSSSPTKDLELERLWRPISGNELWELLGLGLSDHLEKVDLEITRDWQRLLAKTITRWFEISPSEIDPKFLKKLTNATLAAGSAGNERVKETLSEWPVFVNLDQRKGKMEDLVEAIGRKSYKVSGDFTSKDFCRDCEKGFQNDDYVVTGKPMHQEDNHLHFICFLAESLKREGAEYRNAKLGFYKQAKCVRSILGTQRGREGIRSNKTIETYQDYLTWRSALIQEWQDTTNVKEIFHNNYIKNFDDYARLVLQVRINPSFETSFLESKLSKHFDSKKYESIIDNYLMTFSSKIGDFKKEVRDPASNRIVDYQIGGVQIESKRLSNTGQFAGIADVIRKNMSVMLDVSNYPANQKQRFLDFMYGLIQGSNLKVQKISPTTYFLTQPATEMFGPEFKVVDAKTTENQLNKFFEI